MDDDGNSYHGNYQGANSDAAVIKYCTKEGEYISSMTEEEINARVKSRENKTSMVGALIMTEGVSVDVIRKYPELLTKDIAKLQRNH